MVPSGVTDFPRVISGTNTVDTRTCTPRVMAHVHVCSSDSNSRNHPMSVTRNI